MISSPNISVKGCIQVIKLLSQTTNIAQKICKTRYYVQSINARHGNYEKSTSLEQ